MKVKIICVGKLKEKYLIDAVNEYSKRLSKYGKVEVLELSETKLVEDKDSYIKQVVDDESNRIIEKLDKKDFNILLSLRGKMLDSVELSKFLQNKIDEGNANFTFIIGGSYGTSKVLEKSVDMSLCLSKLTFPHQIVRVLILEQIYRSFKIMHNETYHK